MSESEGERERARERGGEKEHEAESEAERENMVVLRNEKARGREEREGGHRGRAREGARAREHRNWQKTSVDTSACVIISHASLCTPPHTCRIMCSAHSPAHRMRIGAHNK